MKEKTALYSVFFMPPLIDIPGLEPHEMDEHEKRFLLRQSLTELTATHLHNFIFEIGVIDWQVAIYFMPRLIELALNEQMDEFDSHGFRLFLNSKKDNLTTKQKAALRQYGQGLQKKNKKRGHTKEYRNLLALFLSL